MSAKSKFKRFLMTVIILGIAGALTYLTLADVSPQRTQVIKEVSPTPPQ